MTIVLVPLTEERARALVPQAAQSDTSEAERIAMILAQAEAGPTTAVVHAVTGEVLCLGGVLTEEAWPHRGVAWSVLSASAGPHLLPITRALKTWLGDRGLARIELYVDAQFPQGSRWARLLGFNLETPLPMRRFLPNGNGAYMYGRTR